MSTDPRDQIPELAQDIASLRALYRKVIEAKNQSPGTLNAYAAALTAIAQAEVALLTIQAERETRSS
jgi:hypothetical protein